MIRVCHPADYFGFLEYDESKNIFTGLTAFIANDIFATVKKIAAKKNYTLALQPRRGYGEPLANNNGSYTGCIGQMQNNQSDLMMMLVDYPSKVENVSVGMMVTSTYLDIGSAYTFEGKEVSTVLSMFKSFDVLLYLIIAASLLIIWWISRVKILANRSLFARNSFSIIGRPGTRGRRTSKNKVAPATDESPDEPFGPDKSSAKAKRVKSGVKKAARANLFRLILHFCKIVPLDEPATLFDRVIFLTVSLMGFWLLFYFSSLIKTELVVIKDPFIIQSYEDILKHKVRPLFIRGGYHHYHYKFARDKSIEREIWDKSVQKYGLDKVLIDLNYSGLLSLLFEVFERKTVILLDDLVSRIVTKSICQLKSKDFKKLVAMKSLLVNQESKNSSGVEQSESQLPSVTSMSSSPAFLTSIDSKAKNIIKGVLLSETMMKSPKSKCLRKYLKAMFEMGFFIAVKERAQRINVVNDGPQEMLQFLGPTAKEKLDSVRDCFSTTPVKPDVKLYGLTFELFFAVFTPVIGLIATAGLFLNFEMILVVERPRVM